MARRKATARVQVPVRMLEAMRAKLEKAAKTRGTSLNAEIVHRLNASLMSAESLLTDVLGSSEKLLFALLSAMPSAMPSRKQAMGGSTTTRPTTAP